MADKNNPASLNVKNSGPRIFLCLVEPHKKLSCHEVVGKLENLAQLYEAKKSLRAMDLLTDIASDRFALGHIIIY